MLNKTTKEVFMDKLNNDLLKNYIFITTRSFIHKIPIDDIFLVERHARKLFVLTSDHEYEYYEKLDNVESRLDDYFLKCHASCIINMRKVRKFQNQVVEFDNGYNLILGKNSFVKAKQRFYAFIADARASSSCETAGSSDNISR